MYKLVLIFAFSVVITQNEILSDNVKTETEELQEWVYWNAFSKTFNETADFWKAESAALEAESKANEIVEAEEWLAKIENKESIKKQNQQL
ncbi:hypothetical protein [Flavobacteriaceae bacterium 14752]|uniref:hypothetical protein n=1 Tax=Mesohalobacter salilacus TaxID=2491711 RepID=UPI000F642398|nr:hypothetical protein EIG84_03445 [Flavobacteriaceae bacterium 14752]